ncbi:MAG: DAK2 domain-containing protein, partial [Bifidobacteriaceae bacterium]|nr:DAK2 domain-containing protein [Bifidobacteriaceae bacterium]
LDEELETAWRAPADTPAYRKGSLAARPRRQTATPDSATANSDSNVTQPSFSEAAEPSRIAAATIQAALVAAAQAIEENVTELGRLDAVAGDGDHGIGMARGVAAATEAAEAALGAGAGAGGLLKAAGDAWALKAGGTSGALWGVVLRGIGQTLGDIQMPDAVQVAAAVTQASRDVATFGKAQVGDKTMLDALVPFAATLEREARAGARLTEAWARAAEVARQAAESTAGLTPRIGRARPHAAKSVGTPDPGAISLAIIVGAVATVLGSDK